MNRSFDNDHFRGIVKCRNTVAHGWLLGLSEDDLVVFQVQETQGIDANAIVTTANGYSHNAFEQIARQAEGVIPQMEKVLGLEALRRKRRAPTLAPHMKTRPKAKPRGGR